MQKHTTSLSPQTSPYGIVLRVRRPEILDAFLGCITREQLESFLGEWAQGFQREPSDGLLDRLVERAPALRDLIGKVRRHVRKRSRSGTDVYDGSEIRDEIERLAGRLYPVMLDIQYNRATDRYVAALMPASALGEVFMTLLAVFTDATPWRVCRQCGGDYAPRRPESKATYCSKSCRETAVSQRWPK